jgi:hypothetical protein
MDGRTRKIWEAGQYGFSLERNLGMAWRHGITSQNEIPVQLGEDPAAHSSDGETPTSISQLTS